MECHCVLFMDEIRWKQACALKQMKVQINKPYTNWHLNQIEIIEANGILLMDEANCKQTYVQMIKPSSILIKLLNVT